ncbi:hypothetical protein ScPMuIL_016574 [Solemya velum]
MENQDARKPLGTRNDLNSKLPMPSKLRPPGPVKRAMSPELCRPTKRSRLDSNTSQQFSKSYSGSLPSSNLKTSVPERPKPTGVATRSTAVVRPTTKSANSVPSTSKAARSKSESSSNAGFKKPVSSSVPKAPTGGSKKRPAWDLKGRLQDMEEVLASRNQMSSTLHSQLESYNQRINMLESQNNHLSGTVAQAEKQTTQASAEISDLQRRLREADDEFNTTRRKLQQELDDITFTKSTLERQKESLNGELEAAQQQINGLRTSVAQMTSAQAGISAELEATKLCLEQASKECRMKDTEIALLKKNLKDRDDTIEDYHCKFREHESVRRKLHNNIQELKGNIRVFCRVRPLLGDELGPDRDGDVHHMNFPDIDQKIIELEKLGDVSMNESTLAGHRRGNKYDFSFDRVFQPASTQKEVFEEISQLVQSALDGYNVCIFAYGQTGSGKTFTMQGPDLNDEEKVGMIPRSVAQIFQSVRELQTKGWQYDMEASFLEIYNETIRDLLSNGKEDKYEIKLHGPNSNEVTVTNLTLVNISSEDQINNLLARASDNRAVAETKCNEHSSRSHSVFRLKLTGNNKHTNEICQGTLNLVDLAGSERLKESGSEGQRLKETLCINKSLSNLGNVIMALANKDSHIPYRNSKLTYLLQNSLGGNSKTLMFVNVSPREENFQETLNSLRFATKVNNCNIGTAQKKSK